MNFFFFDSALVDIPCIVSGIGSIFLFFYIIFSTHIYIGSISSCFACTQVYQSPLGLWPTAAIHNCICPSNHFLPLKQSSWNLPRYLNLVKSQMKNFAGTGDWTQVCNSQSCLWCIYCWIALMQTWKSEIGSSRGGLRPYPLRFHVEEACADAKLNQHGPLGVAYHRIGIQYLPSQLQGLQHTPRCPVYVMNS
jgi:hypothetical protein